MTIEFKAWPKIARLNRQIFVTEKIDGTNAAIIITESGEVGAQSRSRVITPEAGGDVNARSARLGMVAQGN